MVERRAGSQTINLIIDQKKSRIDPIYLDVEDVQYNVEKHLIRAITLLQTAFQSEVCS